MSDSLPEELFAGCFPSHLYANLKLIGTCNPEGGSTCEITCRDESTFITDPNAATCLSPGLWSKIKPCSGGNKDVDFFEKCTERQPKEKCAVECKKGFLMVGDGDIMCNYKLKWNSLLSRERHRYLKPKLSRVLALEEVCTSKQFGDRRKLECKEGAIRNGVLSQSVVNLCPSIVLQDDLLESKRIVLINLLEKCVKSFVNGGNVIGENKMKCLEDFQWSKPRHCVCAPPNFSESIKLLGKCDFIPKMGTCLIHCRIGYNIIGNNGIVCQTNGKWGGFPTYQKVSCLEPVMSAQR
ncbi:sushi, von Willebrand factor type A, EGF and pentraxin domain-containing protein 1 [Trichonephila clavipes]|nr:sushi, von Willebrand factor type A, EGF and pentraxin domain-containing protein 1 [Trichonephila clavipes]